VLRDRGRAVDDLEVASGSHLEEAVTPATRDEPRGDRRLAVRRDDQVADVEHLVLGRVRLVERGLDIGRKRGDRAEGEPDRVDAAVGEPGVYRHGSDDVL